MGMEDFFLGALGGVAQAGAQGAATEFQNEQELLRQQSLLDLQNRYKSQAFKQKMEAAAALREQRLGTAQEGLDIKDPSARTAEQLAAMAELDIEAPEPGKGLTDPQAEAIARWLGQDVETVRGLAAENALPSAISAKFNKSDKEPKIMTLYDPVKNEIVDMTASKAVPLINSGELIPARREVIDGKAKILAGGFEINPKDINLAGEEGGDRGPSEARRLYASAVKGLRQSPAASRNNFSFANPQGADLGGTIEAVRGISDSTVAFFRQFSPTSSVMDIVGAEGGGEATIGARKELSIINGLTRRMFDVMREGRGSNADITLADAFNAGQNPFQNILGSDTGVELALKKTRDLMVSMRRSGMGVLDEEDASDSRINNAKQVISVAEQALGHIDNMFAVNQLSQLTDTVNGREVPITQILKTPEQVAEILFDPKKREKMTQREQALLTFYYSTLLAERGLN